MTEAKTESRNQILTESPRQNGECVRVSLDEFKGFVNVHIRVWRLIAPDDIRPSRKGIALRLEPDELDSVIEGLRQARASIEEEI
ncbi:MAG: transcriptional coactivator p15/PC4 family protein [bacterium]